MASLRRITTLFLGIAIGAAVWTGAAQGVIAAPQSSADAASALRNAQKLFDAGKWAEAIRAYENFQNQFPNEPAAAETPFLIAEALVQLGQYREAQSLLLQHFDDAPSEGRKALAMFRIGECAYFLGEHDKAHHELETFRSQYPNHEKDIYALRYLGEILLDTEEANPDEAKELFLAAIKKYEKMAASKKEAQLWLEEAKMGLAQAQAASDEIPAAISTLKRIAEDTKSSLAENARVRLGRLYYDAQRYNEAIAALKPLEKAAKGPNKNWGLYWLGRAYLARQASGDDALAIAAFKAVHISQESPQEPPVPEVAYFLGQAYRTAGQWENAIGRFEKSYYDYPESRWADEAFLALMQTTLDSAKRKADLEKITVEYYATAASDFTSSDLYPQMEQIVGIAFIRSQQYKDAKQIFSRLTERYSKGADADSTGLPQAFVNDNYLYLAMAELGQQNPRNALDAINNIAATNDTTDDFRLAVTEIAANAHFMLKDYQRTIAPLEEHIRLRSVDPATPRLYEDLAFCQIMTKQAAAAQRTIDEMRNLDPDLIGGEESILKAEQRLAIAAVQQKETELARHIYTMLTFPQNPQPYIDFGKEGLALLASGRAPALDGESPSSSGPSTPRAGAQQAYYLFQEGLQAEQQGDSESALEKFRTVYTDYSSTSEAPQAMLAAGRILDRTNRDREAVQLLSELVSQYADFPQLDHAYYRLAWTRIESGDLKGGQEAFRRLVESYPNSLLWVDAAYRVAEYESLQQNRDVANQLLDEILRRGDLNSNSTRLLDHILYLRGQNAFVDGKWTVVETYMRRVLEETPESPLRLSAMYWRAEAAYKTRDWNLAQQRFMELAQEAQGRTDSWLPVIPLRLAQIYAWKKQWNEARIAATDLKRAYPNFERMHEVDYLLGRCFMQMGRFDEARRQFKQVIDADPQQAGETAAMAQWMIGETYFRQKEYETAINAYDRVLKRYPQHPYWHSVALLQIGKCYLQVPNDKLAIAAFDTLLKNFPDSAYAESARSLKKAAEARASAARGNRTRYR